MPFPPNLSAPPTPSQTPGPHKLMALQGLTILAVEDSRFTSDALRLMCQRSGARLRRADSLHTARAHLAVYLPDVMLIDLGLPDGRGEELIRDLTAPDSPHPVVLAMSGDPLARSSALAAGAAGFLDKPFPGLAAFQRCLLAHLPDSDSLPDLVTDSALQADRLALTDDLAMAAAALRAAPGLAERVYLSGFLAGLARQTQDEPLHHASAVLAMPGADLEPVAKLIDARLAISAAFAPSA